MTVQKFTLEASYVNTILSHCPLCMLRISKESLPGERYRLLGASWYCIKIIIYVFFSAVVKLTYSGIFGGLISCPCITFLVCLYEVNYGRLEWHQYGAPKGTFVFLYSKFNFVRTKVSFVQQKWVQFNKICSILQI